MCSTKCFFVSYPFDLTHLRVIWLGLTDGYECLMWRRCAAENFKKAGMVDDRLMFDGVEENRI
tara:strand:+ start:1628 stop:1816 length:189 start_codon:yes stop_codon:yes gene_type:complete